MKQVDGKRAVLENGVLRKEVKFGFSWGAFFLGFIYPLIKGDYMVAGISFAVIGVASMIFFPLIFSWIALKKSVDKNTLKMRKEEIIAKALKEEN